MNSLNKTTGIQKNNAKTLKQKEPKIFLSCLPKSLKKDSLLEYFKKHGEISKFEFEFVSEQGNESQTNLINGILTCADERTRDEILKSSEHEIEGFNIKAKPYLTKEELGELYEITRKRRIYIKKLPELFDNSTLRTMLGEYGELEDAYCVYGTKKRRKGFKYGYAIFKEEATLEKLPEEGFKFGKNLIEWTSYKRKHDDVRKNNSPQKSEEKEKKEMEEQRNLINELKQKIPKKLAKEKKKHSRGSISQKLKKHFFKPGEILYHRMKEAKKRETESYDENKIRMNLGEDENNRTFVWKRSSQSFKNIHLQGGKNHCYHLF